MKIYRLTSLYPGSPEIGYTLNGMCNEFYTIKPNLFPQLWECFDSEKTVKSKDNVLLHIGDKYYRVDGFKIRESIITEQSLVSDSYEIVFFSKEKAYEKRNENINIKIENETIVGEDITLYGVCVAPKSWDYGISTSIKLCERPGSENWRWFRTEEERSDYYNNNKPIYSSKMVDDILVGIKKNIIDLCKLDGNGNSITRREFDFISLINDIRSDVLKQKNI